jgi:polyhydroxybutyrate depolymerase
MFLAASITFVSNPSSLQAVDLIAAPATTESATCQRGTDHTGRISILRAQGRTISWDRWALRPYIVHLPPSYTGREAVAVVINIHGAGGTKEAARIMSCRNGDLNDPGCLDRVADCEGFITVYPDGTSNPMVRNLRTFNAGGGAGGYACASGYACKEDIDDVSYFTDLIDTLHRHYNIDRARVYLTGFSNGAAMTHRLACELPNRIAAIAPVSAGNQFSTIDYCSPTHGMPVLEIHGTEDRCWQFDGGPQLCGVQGTPGDFISTTESTAAWAARNGCDATPIVEDLPDMDPADGTTVTRISYPGCANGADVVLLRINGGGHTWPGGTPMLPPWIVGNVSRELDTSRVMWEFFKAHPMR